MITLTTICGSLVALFLLGGTIWLLLEIRRAPLCNENERPIDGKPLDYRRYLRGEDLDPRD